MADSFRVDGLPGFVVEAQNLKAVLKELKDLDPNLRKELVREMKRELTPIANALKAKIPGAPPLSGFSPSVAKSPYRWAVPRMTIQAAPGKTSRKYATFGVVAVKFNDQRPNAGLSILETAGSAMQGRDKAGMTPQGLAMVRNLNRRYPVQGGLGRFVIPAFKASKGEAEAIAKKILDKFARKVGRRIS
jgi:hypothetical protein